MRAAHDRRRRAPPARRRVGGGGGGLGGGGADVDGADVDGGADIDGGGAGIDGDSVAAFDAFDAARRDAPLSNATLAATLLKFGWFFLEVRRPARALASLQRALERRAGYAEALGDVGSVRADVWARPRSAPYETRPTLRRVIYVSRNSDYVSPGSASSSSRLLAAPR